jgi:hypothetical protein
MEYCFFILTPGMISEVYTVDIVCRTFEGQNPLCTESSNVSNKENKSATRITLIDKEDKSLPNTLTADVDLEGYDK